MVICSWCSCVYFCSRLQGGELLGHEEFPWMPSCVGRDSLGRKVGHQRSTAPKGSGLLCREKLPAGRLVASPASGHVKLHRELEASLSTSYRQRLCTPGTREAQGTTPICPRPYFLLPLRGGCKPVMFHPYCFTVCSVMVSLHLPM